MIGWNLNGREREALVACGPSHPRRREPAFTGSSRSRFYQATALCVAQKWGGKTAAKTRGEDRREDRRGGALSASTCFLHRRPLSAA